MNIAILCGRLAHTPELKATPSGAKVATASLATNHVYYDDNKQKVENTDWHNLVAWNKTAETMAQYLKGGDQIMVHGRIVTRSWDGEDGKKRYRTEIIVERFEFGAKNMSRDDRQNEARDEKPPVQGQGMDPNSIDYPTDDINVDDIPF